MLNLEFSDFGGSPNWIINALKLESKEIAIDSLVMHPKEAILKQQEELELKLILYPFLVSNIGLLWSVSDPTLASVENGKVKALQVGSVYVKAQVGQSSIADSCLITIEEPEYLDSAFFDLGTIISALVPSAKRVSHATFMNNSFGWIDLAGLDSRDRGSGNAETRDFVFSASDKMFRVYLNNNTYAVVVKQGDNGYPHDNMKLSANGKVVAQSISSNPGQFIETAFDIVITNGVLDLTFSDEGGSDANWVVNSILIKQKNTNVGLETINHQEVKDWSSFKIIDLNGKVLSEVSKNSSENLLLPDNLRSGIYLISFYNSDKQLIEVKKIYHSGM